MIVDDEGRVTVNSIHMGAGVLAGDRGAYVMPLFGLFTDWFTDWAARRLIFNPKEPKKYFGVVTWHGLFLKHRIPVSEEYGVLIATRLLTSDRLVRSLFTGPRIRCGSRPRP